eukprot:3570540-Pleurochrysis_carterae.AAC.1
MAASICTASSSVQPCTYSCISTRETTPCLRSQTAELEGGAGILRRGRWSAGAGGLGVEWGVKPQGCSGEGHIEIARNKGRKLIKQ